MQVEPKYPVPEYGPLVDTCRAWGINRTKAFELAKSRLLDVFYIGRKPMVRIESLRTLPDRLSELESDREVRHDC